MDGLIGRGGQDEQLVPLVSQEPRVDVHGELVIEGKSARPLDQFVHDGVSDLTELLLEICRVLVQQLSDVLKQQLKTMKIN